MGKFAFSTGTRAVNKVVICQRCKTNKKLAIDNYCIPCGIAVLSGEAKVLKAVTKTAIFIDLENQECKPLHSCAESESLVAPTVS